MEFDLHLEEFNRIIKKGGPSFSDYHYIKNATFDLLSISLEEAEKLNSIIKPILEMDTMIGFTFKKPYGYSGDFELIHRIYTEWETENTSLKCWDKLYHWAESAQAVRNRKKYLIKQISKSENKNKNSLILNLGSGPCTDIYEYFSTNEKTKITIDCIDMDSNAIKFASTLCSDYSNSISYYNKNVFRYHTDKRYDLIWSAGLFDYFKDKLFVKLLNRYYSLLNDGGELVVGNFSKDNPSQGLMEVLCQWYLHHRSKDELYVLALKADIPSNKIEILSEPTGINLFLHAYK